MEEHFINQYGVHIKKCCASCLFNLGSCNNNLRDCKLGAKNLKPTFLCRSWNINPNLHNAGKGGGKIKKPFWYNWLQNEADQSKKYRDLVAEFEKKHGSRYLSV